MRPHSVAGDDPGAWARKSVQGWMMQEAEAVNWVASRLEAGAVREALDLLASCSRLLTIVGTGVSGLVAAKLAATFTSSGTPAMSLNASDALHGGLGVARRDDVVLAISNSGRTEETLLVVEQLSAAGIPVIALTGNTSSPLANATGFRHLGPDGRFPFW